MWRGRGSRDAAMGSEIAFACLPSPEISRQVALDPAGIAACRELGVYVEMSTIGSTAVKEIAEGLDKTGIAVLDAPVSGGPRGARAGTLSTMVAGPRAALEKAKPYLETIARNVFYIGEAPGLGQVTKLANNMISAAGMAVAFEASAMAVKAGVDARVLIDTINASTGRNSATMDKFPASVLTRARPQCPNVGGRERGAALVPRHDRGPRQRRLHHPHQNDRELGRRNRRWE
jgi:3-hydroxyisobutyrate dehydrogenase-like beta-hydroxyacid dehydrogenase